MAFVKGKPRPPGAGRKKGSANKATERVRKLLEDNAAEDKLIEDKLKEAAKTGDMTAIGLYYRWVRPPLPRATYIAPIEYSAPKTLEEARQTIIVLGERLAKGEISIEAHDTLVAGLRAYLGDKAVEQQRDLDDLKALLRYGQS
jgi:hypothetical protein